MTRSPSMLFLTWQEPESRRIFPIGRLVQLPTGEYEFTYIRAVSDALAVGFDPLLSFPNLDEVYRYGYFPSLFGNRLMRASRTDYPAHVAQLGLDPTNGPLEPFTVLARSGGRRATDNLEVFAPPTNLGTRVEGLFLARGVRYVPHAEQALQHCQAGTPLYVLADVQNAVARYALALRTEQTELVGYIPDYLAAELHRLQAPVDALEVTAERVNLPPAPIQHRLLCRFTYPADQSTGAALFQSERYRPLPANASSVAA